MSAGAGTCPVALAELWRGSLEYPLWGCGIPLDSLSPLFSEVVKGHWGTGTGQWSQGTPSVTDSERYLMPNVYEILEKRAEMHVLDLPPMEQVSLDGTDRSTPPRTSGKAQKSCSRQGLGHL